MYDNYFEELQARFPSMPIEEIKREYCSLTEQRRAIMEKTEDLNDSDFAQLERIEPAWDYLGHYLAHIVCNLL